MNIARASIEKPILTWIVILGCLLGGLWGFASLGRLEDPAFTIKQAVISTTYPGASAEQVARELSEPLESAIQQMGEIDIITSVNQPGRSLIEVEVKSTYDGSALPEIWTKLRAKVRDALHGACRRALGSRSSMTALAMCSASITRLRRRGIRMPRFIASPHGSGVSCLPLMV